MTEMAGIETTDQAGPGVVYQGHIGIEWPAPRDKSLVLPGWGCTVWDALNGKPITTVTRIELHARANDVITADVTMLADEDGQPLFHPEKVQHPESGVPHDKIYVRDGKIIEGTFPFLVAEMRVAQPAPERAPLAPKFTEPCGAS